MLNIIQLAVANSNRFPRPEFESDYTFPDIVHDIVTRFDSQSAFILAICLLAGIYLIHYKRSRIGVVVLALICLAYFGFWRYGCVCPIGSIGRVSAAVGAGTSISYGIAILFLLPIVVALFFGRIFCSGICPLGAIQELAYLKITRLPRPLSAILEILPWLVLGVTVMMSATGAFNLICYLDPFVSFFRLGGHVDKLVYSFIFLAFCALVFRPFCRFLCPYGVILGLASKLSMRKIEITAKSCVNCGMCENICPANAIIKPEPKEFPGNREESLKRLKTILFVIVPMLFIALPLAGYLIHPYVARYHSTVSLADTLEYGISDAAKYAAEYASILPTYAKACTLLGV